MKTMAVGLLAVVAVAGMAGCSSSNERSCVRSGVAEVCGTRDHSSYSVTISTKGLEPGSKVELTTDQAGTTDVVVGANGQTEGLTFLKSAVPVEWNIQVRATAAGGSPFDGTLTLGAKTP
jgi:hypothetical protein